MSTSDISSAGEFAAGPRETETVPRLDWSSASTAAAPAVPDSAPAAVPAAADDEPKRRIQPRWVPEAIVLAAFLIGGIVATWPRASFLIQGKLPLDGDQTQYVWDFWWIARQVTHLGNPWFTNYMAAPVGVRLGYDTLMPLPGIVMTPVTLLFGPSVSYNLVAILAPGLAAYAMYRAARLWLPSRTGAIAAGAFYGYSSMLTSQAWSHIHTALGCIFLPLTLEATIWLRRRPGVARGIVLGLIVGGAVLVDQEMALLAVTIAVLGLVPWLLRRLDSRAFWATAVAALCAAVVASPQLYAMVRAGGRGGPPPAPAGSYARYSASLPDLFAPSPHLASFGLTGLASLYGAHMTPVARSSHLHEMVGTFGVTLTVTALLGLVVGWRRRGTGRLALLWLGGAILSLGPTLYVAGREYVPLSELWHGVRVSLLMPETWLIRLPALSPFREADRLALLGLVGAALLAGAGVDWLRSNGRPLIVVVAALAVLEAGWSGIQGDLTVPTTLPAVDRPIAADHTGSVVLDVPFIVRGPSKYGTHLAPYALNLATADGHPRAMSFSSGVPERTIAGIKGHPFYFWLVSAERGGQVTGSRLAAARQDLKTLHIGWVLIWLPRWVPSFPLESAQPDRPTGRDRNVMRYLEATGFVFDYRADSVIVYRPAP